MEPINTHFKPACIHYYAEMGLDKVGQIRVWIKSSFLPDSLVTVELR